MKKLDGKNLHTKSSKFFTQITITLRFVIAKIEVDFNSSFIRTVNLLHKMNPRF